MIRTYFKIAVAAAIPAWTAGAVAEPLTTVFTNAYGTPGGLIDMPTAEMAPDGQLATTFSYVDGFSKTTLTFQITPRLTGSFRYSATKDLTPTFSNYYDRSFDIRYRILDEGRYHPAVAIGLQDFVGTGLLAGEYVVATKSIGKKLRVTGGVGWGRLGSYASDGSTGSRPPFSFAGVGTGGDFEADNWFHGDLALFGGASYHVNDRLSFSVEYSSDAYDVEKRAGIVKRSSPWNFGMAYKVSDDIALRAFSLHGEEIGASVTFSLNPKTSGLPGGGELAPLPVAVRPRDSAADLGWVNLPERQQAVTASVGKTLDAEGIDLHAIELTGTTAHVMIRNTTYDARAQAMGRTLRGLSRTLPASVETLHVTFVSMGMPVGTMTLARRDLERLENAPADQALAAAEFRDSLSFGRLPRPLPESFPRFDWSIGPYMKLSMFDPDNPLRADFGIRARGDYHIGSGWVASGSVSAKAFGNLDDITRPANSRLPHVRSDVAQYSKTDEPTIDRLTLAKYGRPGPNFYSRITAGYLEQMYAGASGEVLWKPVKSRLALGAEINYVRPRDFDQKFGLRSRTTAGGVIPEVNGHVSAYYDFGNGFHGQLDAGRYLAGDWGATITLDREFANGWIIGAFATKTDVSSQDFGEGSFDKGIRISVPMSWLTGKPTQRRATSVIRPLTRDGGARLEVDGRLYETVRDTHRPQIAKSWGKFWR